MLITLNKCNGPVHSLGRHTADPSAFKMLEVQYLEMRFGRLETSARVTTTALTTPDRAGESCERELSCDEGSRLLSILHEVISGAV